MKNFSIIIKQSKKGLLVKRIQSLEGLKKIDTIVFDKTGTLTQNKMTVVEVYTYENENLSLADNVDGHEVAATTSYIQDRYLNLASILCNDSDINNEGIEIGDPTGPMQKGITYIVLPFIQPV